MKSLPLILLGCLSLSSAQAAIIFGNLAAYTSDTTNSTFISGIAYTPANPDAVPPTGESYLGKSLGFTMGGEAYTVTTLTLRLDNLSGTTDAPTVRIYTNNGSNAPGTFVGGFTNPSNYFGATETDYVFTASTNFTLNPSASYFIVVQQLNNTGADLSFQWQNGQPTITPTGVASNPVARFGGGISPTSHTQTTGSSWRATRFPSLQARCSVQQVRWFSCAAGAKEIAASDSLLSRQATEPLTITRSPTLCGRFRG
jgi:hypothetical protein